MKLAALIILPLIVSSPATFVIAAVSWRLLTHAFSSPVPGDGTTKVRGNV